MFVSFTKSHELYKLGAKSISPAWHCYCSEDYEDLSQAINDKGVMVVCPDIVEDFDKNWTKICPAYILEDFLEKEVNLEELADHFINSQKPIDV